MVYVYKNWTLYKIEPEFKGIGKRPMYFFSKNKPKRGIPCDMPMGYEMIISKRTGLPLLKYSGNKLSLYKKKKLMKKSK